MAKCFITLVDGRAMNVSPTVTSVFYRAVLLPHGTASSNSIRVEPGLTA
jgi:hypothetical protein